MAKINLFRSDKIKRDGSLCQTTPPPALQGCHFAVKSSENMKSRQIAG